MYLLGHARKGYSSLVNCEIKNETFIECNSVEIFGKFITMWFWVLASNTCAINEFPT